MIVAAFMDSYNNIVKAVRNYKAQNIEGGLGTGGQLGVQGDDEMPVKKKKAVRKKR